jgi:hypothetical protein
MENRIDGIRYEERTGLYMKRSSIITGESILCRPIHRGNYTFGISLFFITNCPVGLFAAKHTYCPAVISLYKTSPSLNFY